MIMKKLALPALCLLLLAGCSGQKGYKDGVFRGEATGYSKNTPIEVEVSIVGGSMAAVDIISHDESVEQVPQVQEALDTLPGAIVKKNTTQIDGIAGATETSKGIGNAVEKALERAK